MNTPGKIHPKTGLALEAVYTRSDGRVFWPIIGASPDDDGGDGGDKGGGDGGGDAAAAAAKAAADAAAAKAAADKAAADKGDADLGFPKDTPVAEMSDKQQAAYYKHQSRKHESRATEWQGIAGNRTPEQVKADLAAAEKARRDSMTDAERAVAEAREQATKSTAATVGEQAARVALEFALGHDKDNNDRSALIETIDMRRLTTDDGKVDADKVRALAAQLAPTGKGQGTSTAPDYGAGRRGTGSGKTGVDAGRDMYAASRKTKSTT